MRIAILLKPNSKKGPLVVRHDSTNLTVYVRQPAVDGKANGALITILADYLRVPKTRISIVRGHTSRNKTIDVDD